MQQFDQVIMFEDDDVTAFLHTEVLEQMMISKSIVTAKDGACGIKILQERLKSNAKTKDLVLLDLNMPDMTGLEVLESLGGHKLWNKRFYIVVLTSSMNKKDLEKATKYKITGYLAKPLSHEKLNKALRRIKSMEEEKQEGAELSFFNLN